MLLKVVAMGLVVLTFAVGLLNLGLGYAVAVRLGYGPPTLMGGIEAILASFPDAFSAEPKTEEASLTRKLKELGSISLDQFLDDQIEGVFDTNFQAEFYGDACLGKPIDLASPEIEGLDEKFVETTIMKLHIGLLKSDARATEIDATLQTFLDSPDKETLGRCLLRFREDIERYLVEHGEYVNDFRDRMEKADDIGKMGKDIDSANSRYRYTLETSLEQAEPWGKSPDVVTTHQRLLKEVKKIRLLRHKHLELLEKSFVSIARLKGRLESISPRLQNDPRSRLFNRIGVETSLERWVQMGKKRSTPISVVQFDLDAFGPVNDKFGSAIGDRILLRVSEQLLAVVGTADMAARFAGQQFMLVFVGVGPRRAIKSAEVVRQTLQRTTFLREEEHILLTTSAAITGIIPKDTVETIFARLDVALKDAKKSGGNRLFHHKGSETEPIEAPNLGSEFREIVI